MNTPVNKAIPAFHSFRAAATPQELESGAMSYSVTAFSTKFGDDLVVTEFPYDSGSMDADHFEQQAKTMAAQFAYMMNVGGTLDQIFPPILDECRREVPHAERRLEMAIVANLIHHLDKHGFKPVAVDDGGDEDVLVTDMQSTMEAVFAVDEATVDFQKEGGKRRVVSIVLGNGQDCISDYSYPVDKSDGFVAAMEAFDAESIKAL